MNKITWSQLVRSSSLINCQSNFLSKYIIGPSLILHQSLQMSNASTWLSKKYKIHLSNYKNLKKAKIRKSCRPNIARKYFQLLFSPYHPCAHVGWVCSLNTLTIDAFKLQITSSLWRDLLVRQFSSTDCWPL